MWRRKDAFKLSRALTVKNGFGNRRKVGEEKKNEKCREILERDFYFSRLFSLILIRKCSTHARWEMPLGDKTRRQKRRGRP